MKGFVGDCLLWNSHTDISSCKTPKYTYNEWLRLQAVIFNISKFLWVYVTVQWLAGPKAWHGAVKPEETTLPVSWAVMSKLLPEEHKQWQHVVEPGHKRPQASISPHRLRQPVTQKHTRHARWVSRHTQEPSWHDAFPFRFPAYGHNERVILGKMSMGFGVVRRVGKSLLSSTHCRGRKGTSIS